MTKRYAGAIDKRIANLQKYGGTRADTLQRIAELQHEAAQIREEQRQRRHRNSLNQAPRRAEQRQERQDRLNAIKLSNGCIDCGYKDMAIALHFDHRDPSMKEFSIARGVRLAWERIEAEIAKCDVRCANCHAIRTHQEKHTSPSSRPRLRN